MATATPSNSRLKLTPSNSPYLNRPSRSPMRGRPTHESKLSLKRVIGTTCHSPAGFDTVNSSFAYVAGGAVVVVDVEGENYCQRFYRARPTALPVYAVATSQNTPSTPTLSTPKANDSRGRTVPMFRDSPTTQNDRLDSPTSKTWASRERIKAATCVALSRDGRFLAVGETGYAPRVLIFGLQDMSSDAPLVSISEHAFGVTAVAWSADSRYLASLGSANDGFLYIWKVDPRTGQTRLFQQNRCTSYIKDMVWMGNNLITLGVRHVKFWKLEDGLPSPTKPKFLGDITPSTPTTQKTLPGRNVLLGAMLEATFSCAGVDGNRLLIGTEAGDVCIMDDDDRQMKVLKVLNLGFSVTTIKIRDNSAYIGGRDGQFAILDVAAVMDAREDSIVVKSDLDAGIVAMGFTSDSLVIIDAKQSIDVWNSGYIPGQEAKSHAHIPIPGHGEPVAGIHRLPRPNKADASFLTWSGTGNVSYWDMEGRVKMALDVPFEAVEIDSYTEHFNQIACVKTARNGKLVVSGDRLGVLKVIDADTKECLLDTRAHSLDCLSISIYEDATKLIMASCGRDRTTQLFFQNSTGQIEHFQTLEFSSRVVQVLVPSEDRVITCSMDRSMHIHELVTKEGESDAIAAIPLRVVSLKASPTSITMGPDARTVLVSLLDRSVCQFDFVSGRPVHSFKCVDEGGSEAAVLDFLTIGNWTSRDFDFLLGASNTDKSIRLYDATSGTFLDREWGHSEAINGVSLIEEDDGAKKIVSVGSDGTIMMWVLDLSEPAPRSLSRDPSPVKNGTAGRQTLRRVLSKAELADFQRPAIDTSGRRSPPRTLPRRSSRLNLNGNALNGRPGTGSQISPSSSGTITEDTSSRRRPSEASRTSSPPPSPKARISRRPSLPAMSLSSRKKSTGNLRGTNNTLNTATEQACRTLRAYRKKLSSAEPIGAESLTELDQELRLTAQALGDRAIRSKAMNETVLSGLLDQYSERLATMLDEKLRLTNLPKEREEGSPPPADETRRGSADDDSSSSSP